MKKFLLTLITVCLAAVFLLTFISCCGNNLSIEGNDYKLRTAIYQEEDGSLTTVAIGEEDETYPDAKIVDVRLNANNNVLTIKDNTNGKVYEGAYTLLDDGIDSKIYKVDFNDKQGYATLSYTKYNDGKKELTVCLAIDDYTIYFYA